MKLVTTASRLRSSVRVTIAGSRDPQEPVRCSHGSADRPRKQQRDSSGLTVNPGHDEVPSASTMVTATRRLLSRRSLSLSHFGCEGGRLAQNSKGLPIKTELTGHKSGWPARPCGGRSRSWQHRSMSESRPSIEAAGDPAIRDDLEWRASARGESMEAIQKTLIPGRDHVG